MHLKGQPACDILPSPHAHLSKACLVSGYAGYVYILSPGRVSSTWETPSSKAPSPKLLFNPVIFLSGTPARPTLLLPAYHPSFASVTVHLSLVHSGFLSESQLAARGQYVYRPALFSYLQTVLSPQHLLFGIHFFCYTGPCYLSGSNFVL